MSLLARGLALGLAAALTGCFSDRGVALEVDVPAGVSSVELFVGAAPCDPRDKLARIACTTIAPPPDGSVPLDGDIWFRDAPARYTAGVHGHTATFQLRADKPTPVPIIIAVGFAPPEGTQDPRPVATATLHDLAIPVDSARVVTTALTPAGPLQLDPGGTQNLTGDRVQVWPKKNSESACVVVEHWSHGQHQRDFVVPEDDPDCDDVPDMPFRECNTAAYHGTSVAGGGEFRAECFASGPSACVIGELGCSDDMPGTITNNTCLAEHEQVCVPSAFCGCSKFNDAMCLRSSIASNDGIPRIDCTVPTLLSVLDLCPGSDQIASIPLDNNHFAGSKCDDQPLISPLDATGSGDSGGFGTSASFSGAVMELGSPAQPCHFNLQWKSGPRTIPDTLDYGLIQVAKDKGGLLIPIVFHFMPGTCGTVKFQCTVNGLATDSLWSCAP